MAKGIIFDLDGTLWDAVENMMPAWQGVFEKYSLGPVPSMETLYSLMGKTSAQFAEALFPQLSAEEGKKVIDDQRALELPHLAKYGGRLYDGLEPVLAKLSEKYLLAIVSNCNCGYIETFLKYNGFEKHFTDWEFSGRTGKQKGDNIRLVMERNHIEKAVYVGDTQLDMDGAADAGIPFIFAAYGFGNTMAKYSIDTLSQLPPLAERLLSI